MRDIINSPSAALVWNLWIRHRTLVVWLTGITVFSCLLNVGLPESFRTATEGESPGFDAGDAIELLKFHLIIAALFLFLAICGYTEFNDRTGSIGFPHRLFTLPVTSFRLVALPMLLGVAGVELLGLIWTRVLLKGEPNPWAGLILGVYIMLYQTVLWTLPTLGSLRLVIVGVIGVIFIVALGLPSFPQDALIWWLRKQFLFVWFLTLALAAFFISWIHVARQRSGGGSKRDWAKAVAERLSRALPKRTKAFGSAMDAHFWFEWRRSGFMLPLFVGALLVAVVAPLSWSMRNQDEGTTWILLATLAMPMVLAFPLGKAFSKPDIWSTDMSVPSFIAVRPLSAEDFVVTKMKVAAFSTAIAWLLTSGFVVLWFSLWAKLDGLSVLRILVWTLYGRSLYPQYVLAILAFAAAILLTWRFLVSSLWLGLSGNRRLFATTALPYAFAPVCGLALATLIPRNEDSILNWMYHDFGEALPLLVRLAAIAVAARFWFTAWSWRDIDPVHVRQYLLFWVCSTLGLVAFALVAWAGLRYLLPSDNHQLRTLMILGALLAVPIARLGLAPESFAKNRHRL